MWNKENEVVICDLSDFLEKLGVIYHESWHMMMPSEKVWDAFLEKWGRG